MRFRGIFDHNLDAKNRVTVPSKYREALADGVILAIPSDGKRCVQIWRAQDYEEMTDRALAGRDPLDPDVQELERFYNRNGFDAELDSAHRITVPAHFLEYAGLRKAVRLTGGPGCLELWDRESDEAHNRSLTADIREISARLAHSS